MIDVLRLPTLLVLWSVKELGSYGAPWLWTRATRQPNQKRPERCTGGGGHVRWVRILGFTYLRYINAGISGQLVLH
eukprot:38466-Eustigmatos_ZCMA.PRE.1